jgi:hypothetical protein
MTELANIDFTDLFTCTALFCGVEFPEPGKARVRASSCFLANEARNNLAKYLVCQHRKNGWLPADDIAWLKGRGICV